MVSAVVQGDRGYLYADTAITDPQTGILLGTATKILTTKRLPCAVGVTYVGPPQATTVLKRLEVSDVQTLYARIPQAIRSFKGEALRLGYKNAVMRLLVVAWDERTGKPRMFVAGDGLEAFGFGPDDDAREAPYFFGSEIDLRAHWKHDTPTDPKSFHPVTDAIAVYEQRRQVPYRALGGGIVGHHVGGQLHVAEISQSGAKAFQIHDWEDPIGKPINTVEGLLAA